VRATRKVFQSAHGSASGPAHSGDPPPEAWREGVRLRPEIHFLGEHLLGTRRTARGGPPPLHRGAEPSGRLGVADADIHVHPAGDAGADRPPGTETPALVSCLTAARTSRVPSGPSTSMSGACSPPKVASPTAMIRSKTAYARRLCQPVDAAVAGSAFSSHRVTPRP